MRFRVNKISRKRSMQLWVLFLIFIIPIFQTILFTESNVAFDRILHEEGYSDIIVTSMVQDLKGFIWFGTPNGLYRYDGYYCVVYKQDPKNPESLSNSNVSSLCLDSQGILWIGTEKGLNRFDWSTETFSHYLHEQNVPEILSYNEIEVIYEDREGFLWIGTLRGGLNRFNRKTGKFKHFKHIDKNPNSLSHDRVNSICEDSKGVLWIGTEGGLNRFDRKLEIFKHYNHEPEKAGTLSHNFIWTIYEDRKGTLWIGTWGGGLNKYIKEEDRFANYLIGTVKHHVSSHNRITSICEDRYGTLWIGTRGSGLCKFLVEKESFKCYLNDPNNPHSLSNNMVNTIYEDKTGILWIGTIGGGINKYNRRKEKFFHFNHHPNRADSLSNNTVLSIYEDPDEAEEILWIGTYYGLNRFDVEERSFFHFNHDPRYPHSISNNVVRYILKDKSNVLWVGTDRGLNQFDRETGKFTSFQHEPGNPKSISNNRVITIYEDKKGGLWIGTDGGLNLFNRETGLFTHFVNDSGNPFSLSSNIVLCIYEQSSNNNKEPVLWIGTYDGGLNKFDREKMMFFHYKYEPDNSNSISNNNIRVIYEDRNGILWLGTDGGLNRFNPRTERFTVYTEKEGLADNTVYGILADRAGHLWLSTNDGLSRFEMESGTFKNFNISHGLMIRKFSQSAYCKIRGGEMFFGGVNGLTSFFPDDIKENSHKPDIVITDFRIFNKSVEIGEKLKRPIIETDEIMLSYKDNLFSFEFAALEYTWPEKNRYAYKMEGFDRNWVETDAQTRLASYTNLSPGNYTFRVKGSNNDGLWNEGGALIRIIITPPFWKTWWFRTLMGLFFILCIIGGYKWSTKLLRNKLEKEKRLQKILKLSRDEMEKSRNLAEFRNAENEKLIAAISSLFIAVEANGKVFQWNHSSEKFFGIPEADVKEQLLVDLLKDFITQKKLDEIIRVGLHSDRSTNNIEIPVHFKKDNDSKLLLANISPIMDKRGKKLGFLLLGEDITNRKKEEMQRNLSQRLESLGRMAGNIAHEIKTPLQYIGNNGRFICDSCSDIVKFFDALNQSLNESKKSEPKDVLERIKKIIGEYNIGFILEEIPKSSNQIVRGASRISNIIQSIKDY